MSKAKQEWGAYAPVGAPGAACDVQMFQAREVADGLEVVRVDGIPDIVETEGFQHRAQEGEETRAP
jgi:hypothetical protein